MDLKAYSQSIAQKIKTASPRRALEIAASFKIVVEQNTPRNTSSNYNGWKYAACVYAQALIKGKKPNDAARWLQDKVGRGGLLERDPVAHATYAKALDNAGRSDDAARWLQDKVGRGGLLERDPVAHATYAKALDNAGRSDEAARWLQDKMGERGLLERDPVAVYLYSSILIKKNKFTEAKNVLSKFPNQEQHVIHFGMAKLEICAGKNAAAIPAIAKAIKTAKREIDKLHCYALLLFVLPEGHSLISDIPKVIGTKGFAYANSLAQEWKQKPRGIDIPSRSYYGFETPMERVGRGGYGVDSTTRRVMGNNRDPV
jgi:predicted Zn-dependent protease